MPRSSTGGSSTKCLCAAALALVACSDPDIRPEQWLVCDDVREQVAAFALRCVEGANPKSDEEPEDWIGKCQVMAEQTWCRDVGGYRWWHGGQAGPILPCASATFPAEVKLCADLARAKEQPR